MHAIESPTVLHQRYQIVRLIGEGSTGRVYAALDLSLQTYVALKQLTRMGERHDRAFEREARILARLRHAGLPVVSDYFRDEYGTFLVMDLVAGDDLAELVAQHGALDERAALRITDQLLEILTYMHGQQPPVLHRAIKPHDIRLLADERVVLLDFGLASDRPAGASPATPSQSSLNPYSRSLWYAPPELLYRRPLDARSDLYALAATLYLLLTGQAPPSTGERAACLVAHQPDPLLLASALRPHVSAEVSEILAHALALSPDARPPSALAMRQALHNTPIGRHLWGQPAAPPAAPDITPRVVSTAIILLGIGLGVLLLLALLLAR
ncbi:MAG: serine/threonine-protein kinase [Chloroflexales bacterium]